MSEEEAAFARIAVSSRPAKSLNNWFGFRCALGWCACVPDSGATHCFGRCVECRRIFGATSREDIRRYMEREAKR